MKTTNQIDKDLLDNAAAFKGEFYSRFKLRPAERPLQLTDQISKNYLFPTFYGDVTCAIGIFLCSYEKAKKLLPHPSIKPVNMGGGRSLVVFSNYIYNNVLGVAPYNEVAMTIPILVNPLLDIPVLPMVVPGLFSSFGYYCFSMPVTSLENQIRGVKIWGLPKVVQEIDIQSDEKFCRVEVKEADGRPYYRLKVPVTGKLTHFDVGANLYTVQQQTLQQSQTNFKGDFAVTKHMDRLFKKSAPPAEKSLEILDTPSGRVLQHLEIDPNPFQFRYARTMASCFDLPNNNYQVPLH